MKSSLCFIYALNMSGSSNPLTSTSNRSQIHNNPRDLSATSPYCSTRLRNAIRDNHFIDIFNFHSPLSSNQLLPSVPLLHNEIPNFDSIPCSFEDRVEKLDSLFESRMFSLLKAYFELNSGEVYSLPPLKYTNESTYSLNFEEVITNSDQTLNAMDRGAFLIRNPVLFHSKLFQNLVSRPNYLLREDQLESFQFFLKVSAIVPLADVIETQQINTTDEVFDHNPDSFASSSNSDASSSSSLSSKASSWSFGGENEVQSNKFKYISVSVRRSKLTVEENGLASNHEKAFSTYMLCLSQAILHGYSRDGEVSLIVGRYREIEKKKESNLNKRMKRKERKRIIKPLRLNYAPDPPAEIHAPMIQWRKTSVKKSRKQFLQEIRTAQKWIDVVSSEKGKVWYENIVNEMKGKQRFDRKNMPRPNMRLEAYRDGRWCSVKRKVAECFGELTLLPGVKSELRDEIIRRNGGKDSIFDEELKEVLLNVVPGNTHRENMITLLHSEGENEVNGLPSVVCHRVKQNDHLWRSASHDEIVYFDFEMANPCDMLMENEMNSYERIVPEVDIDVSRLFLIGMGRFSSTGEWIYESFVATELSRDGERECLKSWLHRLHELAADMKGRKRPLLLTCWGPERALIKALKKTYSNPSQKILWKLFDRRKVEVVDVLEDIVRKSDFAIRGAFDNRLKSVYRAVQRLKSKTMEGVEPVKDEDDLNMLVLSDVLDVLNIALHGYAHSHHVESVEETLWMKKIMNYNELDCKMTAEVMDYLRKNH